MWCRRNEQYLPPLRGFVTEQDLPAAEKEWPGLQAFFYSLPVRERPVTFLELVWQFECRRGACPEGPGEARVTSSPARQARRCWLRERCRRRSSGSAGGRVAWFAAR